MNKLVDTTIDPTENVKALTEAEARRQDDLRAASDKYNAAQIGNIEKMFLLRIDYEDRLRDAESKRIDAIRAVDVNAVAVASQRATTEASVLAGSLNQRISAVEKAQYEGQGKTSGTKDLTAIILAVGALVVTLVFGILNYLNK